MARLSIDLPESFDFSIDYRVLYSDVNPANHLGADRLLPITMEAQLQFIQFLGYKDAHYFEEAGLIMASAETAYLSEAYYGDELTIEVAATNFTSKSFELIYRVHNCTRNSEMARVRTTMLFFDYDAQQVIAMPEGFLRRVENQSS